MSDDQDILRFPPRHEPMTAEEFARLYPMLTPKLQEVVAGLIRRLASQEDEQ